MGGIAQAIGGIFGAGGQGGSFTAQQSPDLVNGIAGSTAAVNGVYGQQQNLAAQLQQQMLGQGPNLANALLHQANNQNIAQSAGLMASQQGINPALAAKQGANMAGQLGQQSAAQASTNRMQQQLGAQQQLGGVYNQMANQQLGLNQTQEQALGQQNNVNSNMAQANMQGQQKGMSGLLGGAASVLGLANGGMVPEHLQAMAQHLGYGGQLAEAGGHVAANNSDQKAEVSGDSLKNDKIPAMLSEHEIVIPREVAMAEDAPEKAAEFVAKIKGKKKGGEEDDFKAALKRGMKERK